MEDPMGEIPSPELPWFADWRHWLGFALLAGVIVLIARPVWQLFELVCFFSQMGNMNG
jgi:hypothetical protein